MSVNENKAVDNSAEINNLEQQRSMAFANPLRDILTLSFQNKKRREV